MTLRIDRILVNRGGPLESDFEFESGNLNLIYGQNETGKTYVVESLIRFLFRTNKRASAYWGLRDWAIGGKAIVSGLNGVPVTFTKGGDKLEDYWENGLGLPPDLSRLLVVRAGETALTKLGDGVGPDLLKDYLSGEGLLDTVAGKISPTLQTTTIQGSQFAGNKTGELRTRNNLKTDHEKLQGLIKEVEEGYASGDAYLLRKQKEALVAQVEVLEKARRYHAFQLASQIEGLRREKGNLPTEGEIGELKADISTWERHSADINIKSEAVLDLENASAHDGWAKEALGTYKDVTSGAAGSGPNMLFVIVSLVTLVGTVVFGLLGLRLPLLVSGVLSVLLGAKTYLDLKNAASSAGENAELENLKAAYRTNFGKDLTDLAMLEEKVKELEANRIRAESQRGTLTELSNNTRELEREIHATLKDWKDRDVPVDEWRGTIRALNKESVDLQGRISRLEEDLTSIGVSRSKYVEEDPGTEWDSDHYETLTEALNGTGGAREKEEEELGRLENLKTRVAQETGSDNSDWEELINQLRDKREAAALDYRKQTADILAKIQVHTVIQEFRQQENSRISEGLKKDELTKPLQALTGRYKSIRLDDEQGLVLVTDKDEDYPLASLSTGAREQTFLALRMGFASIAMEGKTGFLILDDAFQHSDWVRRKNLVERTVSFVQSGWQVFHFTMDDHIERLFQEVGSEMGDGFRSCRLG